MKLIQFHHFDDNSQQLSKNVTKQTIHFDIKPIVKSTNQPAYWLQAPARVVAAHQANRSRPVGPRMATAH